MKRRILFRVVAVGLGLIAALCLVAGAFNLTTGRSLLLSIAGIEQPRLRATDAERAAAAARTPGPWALSEDPHVGFRYKSGHEVTLAGVPAHLGPDGLRVRRGPEPEEGATRIVVLGDSVAFGFGLRDTETYAHLIEEMLAGTMRPGSPRPVVRTVATPGWSARNSGRYLLDHLQRLNPHIVLFVFTANDLQDSYNVTEAGQRELLYDPVRGARQPLVVAETYIHLRGAVLPRIRPALVARIAAAGGEWVVAQALTTGLTPESRTRWEACLAGIVALHDRLAKQGVPLALFANWDEPFHRLAGHLMAERASRVPHAILFTGWTPDDSLPADRHPSARCVAAGAWRMTEWLIAKGWVPGAGAKALPAEDAIYASRRAEAWSDQERAAWWRDYAAGIEAFIEDRIDLADGTGFHQVYSEIEVDGTVGRHAYFALENPGGARLLALRVERLDAASRVYPLQIAVRINGQDCGALDVPEPRDDLDFELVAKLPESLLSDRYLDVHLEPGNWITEIVRGRSRLAALRLRSVTLR